MNLVGKRFDHVTVIGKSDKRVKGYVVWHCQCDCGNMIDISTKKLMNSKNISCGCIKPIRSDYRSENLEGVQFNNLTPIKRVESKNGRTRWLCKCTCGNEKIVYTQDFKSGKVKSCGCLRHRKGMHIKDISNQRFGRLVALYPTDKRDRRLSVYWHCKCDCGNEIDVTQSNLVSGDYKSCGCLKKEVNSHINSHLRMANHTCIEFIEKRIHRKDNTSGHQGVYKVKNGYIVKIGFQGKRYYLGVYKDYESAIKARLEAEDILYKQFLEAYYKWSELAKGNEEWASQNPLIFDVKREGKEFKIYCKYL